MTTEFQQKLADLLPDAERELEAKRMKFEASLKETQEREGEYRAAVDLVKTLRQHGARTADNGRDEQSVLELRDGVIHERRTDGSPPPQVLRRGEQRERVVRTVNDAGRPITIGEVAEAVGDDRNRIGAALWKAATMGFIRKLDDGLYAPKETSQTEEAG